MAETKMVMYDDPEAAQPWTAVGWRSRDGFFFYEEHMARYCGCTHRPCEECGAPAPKAYIKCDVCRAKVNLARYEAMPAAPWDGKQMVYSETRDRYYSDPDEAYDDFDDGAALLDPRLVLCEPQYAPTLETDYFEDVVPGEEYGDVPDELLEAIDAFNAALAGRVLSWAPGKFRLERSQADNG